MGGQERRVLAECVGMRDRGHQVWLATPRDGSLFRRARGANVGVIPFSFDRRRMPVQALQLGSLVRRLRPDVVNSHSSADSWTASVARRLRWTKARLVRTRHISAPVRPGPLHRFLYGQADYLITTGEAVREGLAESGLVPLDRSTSIPTGVDSERFEPRPDLREAARRSLDLEGAEGVIGVVAYLRADKGHAVLLRALGRVIETHPRTTLLIVGDGPERSWLETEAVRMGVASRVRFAGLREDVPFVLAALDLFCLPSLRNEGVPQSILQASAAGLPVVSTSVGGIPEAVVDGVTGSIVSPGDPEALAWAIRRLLDDPNLRRAFGDSGSRHVRGRFSVDAMLDRTEAAYRAALGDGEEIEPPPTGVPGA
jgi:glycosyltransferase involved in cell wall biosynthesis